MLEEARPVIISSFGTFRSIQSLGAGPRAERIEQIGQRWLARPIPRLRALTVIRSKLFQESDRVLPAASQRDHS